MKKLIITNLYGKYARGGAESVVAQQVAREKETGNEVVLLTARPTSIIPKKDGNIWHLRPLNIFFYTNDHKHNAFIRAIWHFIDIFNFHTWLETMIIIKREKPDVVHTHNLKGLGYLIPWAIKLMGKKHIHTIHDIQLITPSGLMMVGQENHWHHTGPLTKLYRWITRKLFGSPQIISSPSQWALDEHTKHGFFKNSKTYVVPNQPDPIFAQTKSEASLRGETNERRGNLYIYAGQLEPHKGIFNLIDEFTQKKDAQLHIYGDGSLLQYTKAVAHMHPHITFHGKVTKQQLAKAYTQATYFIYPSLCYENAPMAILEAQAARLTIIASNHGGIGDILEVWTVKIAK